jgi:hypothetical protein
LSVCSARSRLEVKVEQQAPGRSGRLLRQLAIHPQSEGQHGLVFPKILWDGNSLLGVSVCIDIAMLMQNLLH